MRHSLNGRGEKPVIGRYAPAPQVKRTLDSGWLEPVPQPFRWHERLIGAIVMVLRGGLR